MPTPPADGLPLSAATFEKPETVPLPGSIRYWTLLSRPALVPDTRLPLGQLLNCKLNDAGFGDSEPTPGMSIGPCVPMFIFILGVWQVSVVTLTGVMEKLWMPAAALSVECPIGAPSDEYACDTMPDTVP